MTSLEHYAEVNPPAGSLDRTSEELVSFVPMASVSENGALINHEMRPLSEVAKGFTSFERGDVVLAKITPCMENGKAALLSNLSTKRGFGSTEFHVLRPRAGVDPRFVFYLVWNQEFRNEAAKHMTGSAGQKRIPTAYLKQVKVPSFTVDQQRRIADILDKADAIRRKRKEAIALTEELLRSAFLDMFGDPVTNPKGWEVKPLKRLLAIPLRNGLSPASGGAHPAKILTLSAITRGRFDGEAVKDGLFAAVPWDDVRQDRRDFLICRGNGNLALVGAGAFPDESDQSVVFPDTMIAARLDEDLISRSFLDAVWKTTLVRRQIESGARTTNGTFKVNQSVIESICVPVPGIRQQRAFDSVAQRISQMSEKHQHGADDAQVLFASLTHRAFSGSLRG